MAQLRHPACTKPELLATGPDELWSWDVTKLRGPAKWSCFYPYVILDAFSRYVPGWMVATRESAVLAKRLISERYHIPEAAQERAGALMRALHPDPPERYPCAIGP